MRSETHVAEVEADGVAKLSGARTRLLCQGSGVALVFGPIVAIGVLLGAVYQPLAYRNYWLPFDRAACISSIDSERAVGSFNRASSSYTLRSGSDAGLLVHPRRGTGDWQCRQAPKAG